MPDKCPVVGGGQSHLELTEPLPRFFCIDFVLFFMIQPK